MKYSFLVPVYNKLENVKKCIESLLRQTYDNYEIVIVDDKSDYDTISYLKQLSLIDKRIKVNFNNKNLGIGQTRNVLLSYATGDYIIFIDSDDYVENGLLESINNTILNNAGIEIIRFQNIVEPVTLNQANIESKKNPYRFSCMPTAHAITGEEALMNWCLGINKINTMPWTYCIKKEMYSDIIYPNVPYLEDFPITHYLLAKAENVIAIDYIGYHYLQYDSSLTKNDIDKYIYAKEKLKVLCDMIQLTKNYINQTNISPQNKCIFFDDIDKRYLIRNQKVDNLLKGYNKKMH